MRSVRVTFVTVQQQQVIIFECLFLALVIKHVMCMRCIILSVTFLAVVYRIIPHTSQKARFSEKKLLNTQCVLIFSATFVKNISHLKKT